MPRTISSSWTLFYKLLPVTLTVAFAVGFRVALEARGNYDGASSGAIPINLVLLGAVMLFGIGASIALCLPLERVRLSDDGESLLVSNYLREWTVPVGLIADVTQNRWLKLRPITIHLRIDPGCGKRVVFMPPLRLIFRFWREDPEVNELRTLAASHTAI